MVCIVATGGTRGNGAAGAGARAGAASAARPWNSRTLLVKEFKTPLARRRAVVEARLVTTDWPASLRVTAINMEAMSPPAPEALAHLSAPPGHHAHI